MITATLNNHRIAPRKVRLVADLVRGKSVVDAKNILVTALKHARHPIAKLLDSAVANAKNNFNIESTNLYIKEIRVDQGVVLKRFMPVSRGSAHPIKKRTSHVELILAERQPKTKSDKTITGKVLKAKKIAKTK